MNEKPTVIVLSRNYSTGLGIIRALGAAGYTVDLVASVKRRGNSAIASSSKYVRRSAEVLSSKIQGDDGDGIMDVLLEYALHNDEEKILFPVDDFTARVVDENKDLLKDHFRFPGAAGDMTLVDCMNKRIQSEAAKEKGFETPAEWEIDLNDISGSALDTIVYPCFVKPEMSFAGHKTEMCVCENADELNVQLMKMRAFYPDRKVLVQEYLDIDKEYDLSGVSLDDRVIIPAVIEKTRIASYEQGVTMSGRLISFDEFISDMKERGITVDRDNIDRLIMGFGYIGMFDMEFFAAGDRLYFGEVNFRPGGPNYAYTYCGANLPKVLVDELSDGSHDRSDEDIYQFGSTFTYEKVAWEDYIHGYIGKEELNNSLNKVDIKLLDQDMDPAPGRVFARRIRLSEGKHKVLQMAGKEEKNMPKADVIVVGKNYGNILNMVRDLGEAGHTVDVLRILKSRPKLTQPLVNMAPERKSRYVNRYRKMIVDDNCLVRVAEYIRDNCEPGTVVIPVDDISALSIDENRHILADRFDIPGVSDPAGHGYSVTELMDKSVIKELAEGFGLPVAKATFVENSDEIPPTLTYPLFVKPVVSAKSSKRYMGKCEDESQLIDMLRYGPVIAEEYIDIETEYAMLGFVTGGKAYSRFVVKTTKGGSGVRKGVAVAGTTVSMDEIGPLADRCNDFVASLGYSGIYDIDLVKDSQGKIYFLEVNFRAGASMRAFTYQGINIPDMYIRALKGDAVGKDNIPIREESFVSEKLLLEECAAGSIRVEDAVKIAENADVHFINDSRDQAPYKEYRRYYNLFKTFGLRRK